MSSFPNSISPSSLSSHSNYYMLSPGGHPPISPTDALREVEDGEEPGCPRHVEGMALWRYLNSDIIKIDKVNIEKIEEDKKRQVTGLALRIANVLDPLEKKVESESKEQKASDDKLRTNDKTTDLKKKTAQLSSSKILAIKLFKDVRSVLKPFFMLNKLDPHAHLVFLTPEQFTDFTCCALFAHLFKDLSLHKIEGDTKNDLASIAESLCNKSWKSSIKEWKAFVNLIYRVGKKLAVPELDKVMSYFEALEPLCNLGGTEHYTQHIAFNKTAFEESRAIATINYTLGIIRIFSSILPFVTLTFLDQAKTSLAYNKELFEIEKGRPSLKSSDSKFTPAVRQAFELLSNFWLNTWSELTDVHLLAKIRLKMFKENCIQVTHLTKGQGKQQIIKFLFTNQTHFNFLNTVTRKIVGQLNNYRNYAIASQMITGKNTPIVKDLQDLDILASLSMTDFLEKEFERIQLKWELHEAVTTKILNHNRCCSLILNLIAESLRSAIAEPSTSTLKLESYQKELALITALPQTFIEEITACIGKVLKKVGETTNTKKRTLLKEFGVFGSNLESLYLLNTISSNTQADMADKFNIWATQFQRHESIPFKGTPLNHFRQVFLRLRFTLLDANSFIKNQTDDFFDLSHKNASEQETKIRIVNKITEKKYHEDIQLHTFMEDQAEKAIKNLNKFQAIANCLMKFPLEFIHELNEKALIHSHEIDSPPLKFTKYFDDLALQDRRKKAQEIERKTKGSSNNHRSIFKKEIVFVRDISTSSSSSSSFSFGTKIIYASPLTKQISQLRDYLPNIHGTIRNLCPMDCLGIRQERHVLAASDQARALQLLTSCVELLQYEHAYTENTLSPAYQQLLKFTYLQIYLILEATPSIELFRQDSSLYLTHVLDTRWKAIGVTLPEIFASINTASYDYRYPETITGFNKPVEVLPNMIAEMIKIVISRCPNTPQTLSLIAKLEALRKEMSITIPDNNSRPIAGKISQKEQDLLKNAEIKLSNLLSNLDKKIKKLENDKENRFRMKLIHFQEHVKGMLSIPELIKNAPHTCYLHVFARILALAAHTGIEAIGHLLANRAGIRHATAELREEIHILQRYFEYGLNDGLNETEEALLCELNLGLYRFSASSIQPWNCNSIYLDTVFSRSDSVSTFGMFLSDLAKEATKSFDPESELDEKEIGLRIKLVQFTHSFTNLLVKLATNHLETPMDREARRLERLIAIQKAIID